MSSSVFSTGDGKSSSSPAADKPEHVVQFYQDDKFLIDAVSGFVGSALAAGDAAVLIATAAHREGVEQVLRKRGLEIVQAARKGRVIELDAYENLEKYIVESLPDESLFRKVFGDTFSYAAAIQAVVD